MIYFVFVFVFLLYFHFELIFILFVVCVRAPVYVHEDGLSRADSLTNCKDYNMCVVKNNPGMVNGSDPMKVFADIGRTSFWCTYVALVLMEPDM